MTSKSENKEKMKNSQQYSDNQGSSSKEWEFKSNAEYFSALEKWVQEAYMWQYMNAWFPLMMFSQQAAALQSPAAGLSANITSQHRPPGGRTQSAQGQPIPPRLGVEYRIPPLWKRLTAEFLDFLILLVFKVMTTLVAIDFLEFVELDFDSLRNGANLDYQVALQMTPEFFLLEIIHKICVCVYETFFLYRGHDGRVGGATPGKSAMGIKVVYCEKVTQGPNEQTVYVHPATNLGFSTALWRSFFKGMLTGFIFPIFISLFHYQYNQTVYDVFFSTIVVEEQPPIHARPQQFWPPQPQPFQNVQFQNRAPPQAAATSATSQQTSSNPTTSQTPQQTQTNQAESAESAPQPDTTTTTSTTPQPNAVTNNEPQTPQS